MLEGLIARGAKNRHCRRAVFEVSRPYIRTMSGPPYAIVRAVVFQSRIAGGYHRVASPLARLPVDQCLAGMCAASSRRAWWETDPRVS